MDVYIKEAKANTKKIYALFKINKAIKFPATWCLSGIYFLVQKNKKKRNKK